jgi:predicted AlkP superfamily pyrophosphatase or phosphodiesterase
MGVLKNKRGLSRLEFYHTARKLREDITNLLLRDFGVRDKEHKMTTDDHKEITIIEKYPDWLIENFRQSIMSILRSLMLNITAGNTIYPTTMDELALRRRYQNGAIVNCEQLLQEMIYCSDILPVKMEKFLPYVNTVEFEIKLLKGWRKSSNELAKKLKQGVS